MGNDWEAIDCMHKKTDFDFIQSFNRIFEYHPEDRILYVESELNARFNAKHTHVISRARSFQPTT